MIRVVLLAGLAVGGVVMLLWVFQERVIFQPPAPGARSTHAEFVEFRTGAGQQLHAYVIEPADSAPTSPRAAIVFFHGNAELAESRVEWAREAARRAHMPVVLAEYRGYGGVPGTPGYDAAISDAGETIAFVTRRYRLDHRHIILYGHSLGTGVASQLAADHDALALMLECPFTSLADVGREALLPPVTWILPLILRVRFAPLARVQETRTPVWVAVAGQDEVIPPVMARQVFKAARVPGELLEVPTAGHTDLPEAGGQRYWEWFARATSAKAAR